MMNKSAEDKRVFAQIMAEISDSDEDDVPAPPRNGNSRVIRDADISISNATNQRGNPQRSKFESSPLSNAQNIQKSTNFDRDMDSLQKSQPKSNVSSSLQQSKMSKDDKDIENFGNQRTQHQNSQLQSQPSQPPSKLSSFSLMPSSFLSHSFAKADSSESTNLDHYTTSKRWLMRTCSQGDAPMQCYIERDRSGFGLVNQTYKCYLEPSEGQGPRFLMAAKKKSSAKTSYYLVSLEMDPDDRGSEAVLGKLRGNAVGSQYLISDHGLAPEKTVAPSMLRREYGVVVFEFDSGGPSQIGGYIPYVNSSGIPTIWQPADESHGMEAKIESKQFDKMMTLENKKPRWDDAHGGHVLNFQGRVTESSVKNFQMIVANSESSDDVVLQFGRVGKNKFTMDLKYPITPFQAFCICVACLDNKLADRKGYEFIKKVVLRDNDGEEESSTNEMSGSLAGRKSITGMLRENLPSRQYLRDKMTRKLSDYK